MLPTFKHVRRASSQCQYELYLSRWEISSQQNGIYAVLRFLEELRVKHCLSYSALNTARSALSSILPAVNGVKFGALPLIQKTRMIKSNSHPLPTLVSARMNEHRCDHSHLRILGLTAATAVP